MLSIQHKYGIQCIPSHLGIIRTESLKQDAYALLGLEINFSSNVSPYRELAKRVKSDAAVQKLIFNSKHQKDQDFFME